METSPRVETASGARFEAVACELWIKTRMSFKVPLSADTRPVDSISNFRWHVRHRDDRIVEKDEG